MQIKHIFYHPYRLEFKHRASFREGALLKVHFHDESLGYADCHPWTSLGDLPLKDQLERLSTREMTPLTKQSINCAKLDGAARKAGISLLANVEFPKSHLLCMDVKMLLQVDSTKYQRLKVKLGQDLANELPLLKGFLRDAKVKVRLDFNNCLTQLQFVAFLDEFHPFLGRIDFIEDPFLFNATAWQSIQKAYKINLACDRNSEQALHLSESAAVLIVKPAIQDVQFFSHAAKQRLIVTSYLDHPLAQIYAAYQATQILDRPDFCGLTTHHVYYSNPFSQEIDSQGPELLKPSGMGLGFDSLLMHLSWKKLDCLL